MKTPALVDVSVLLIFFNRPDTFAQVFEQVRKARPARLFLYQDGAVRTILNPQFGNWTAWYMRNWFRDHDRTRK